MTLYLDTSSAVKLYAEEPGTDLVRALVERADVIATAAITYAEVRATLARLRREKHMTAQQHAERKRQFLKDWNAFLSIAVTDSLAEDAGALAEQYALTGCDAIQLAAFVQLLQSTEDDEIEFSAFDERLNNAAKKLG